MTAAVDVAPAAERSRAAPGEVARREGAIVNALSIDVEDYFQVSAFAPHIDRRDWDSLPCRI